MAVILKADTAGVGATLSEVGITLAQPLWKSLWRLLKRNLEIWSWTEGSEVHSTCVCMETKSNSHQPCGGSQPSVASAPVDAMQPSGRHGNQGHGTRSYT